MDETDKATIDGALHRIGGREFVKLVALAPTLRAVRGFLDLTQSELSDRCSVSRRTLHKIESGSTNVDHLTLASIRHGLSVLGVRLELKDGNLSLTLKAADVSPALANFREGQAPLEIFGPEDNAWNM